MATDNAAVLSGEPIPVFTTASVREAELSDKELSEKSKRAWSRFIDGKLVEWGRDVAALEDEGFAPPSLDVINLACQIAMELRDEGAVPPTRVVPDGEGGVSFERVEGTLSVSLTIDAGLTVELLAFDDCLLSTRHRVSPI